MLQASALITLIAFISSGALGAPIEPRDASSSSPTTSLPQTLTADAAFSQATPSGAAAMPPLPKLLPLSALESIFGPAHVNDLSPTVNLMARDVLPGHALERRAADEMQVPSEMHLLRQRALATSCVESSANDTYISSVDQGLQFVSAFSFSWPIKVEALCPGARILTTYAVLLYAANQTLTTLGNPTGDTRATLVNFMNSVSIQHIQVDDARPALGIYPGGAALIEMGGNSRGQLIHHVHAYEPRAWSVFHSQEGLYWPQDGYTFYCEGMQVHDNQFGPSGHAPSGASQFKRDNTGTYTPGQWADGSSMACGVSNIYNNVVTDATDGAIVLFGAQGSVVQNNQIISNQRQLLGRINMVDYTSLGNFSGVVVRNNIITSKASLIKVGIAMGTMVWGTDNRTVARTFGGTVENNVFLSGASGYFGYAIAVAGHANAVVSGNVAKLANFGGVESPQCFTSWFPMPKPQAFVADPYTTPGMILQAGFSRLVALVLLICRGPGAITTRNSYFG
ncbi:BQ2448_2719 [Microbotryum intermedium]|uniref:BQ2448_2719 protein n=1 Tax=Microbotryum intermedium TaxID=269621 RepID=A0A238FG76_9BASI|nr:BQ2448_2719 [Microbotryum intermedium]